MDASFFQTRNYWGAAGNMLMAGVGLISGGKAVTSVSSGLLKFARKSADLKTLGNGKVRIYSVMDYSVEELKKRLSQFDYSNSNSKELARWASECYSFIDEMETAVFNSNPEIGFMYEILADIDAQWDMILSNNFLNSRKQQINNLFIPRNCIEKWIEEIELFISSQNAAYR